MISRLKYIHDTWRVFTIIQLFVCACTCPWIPLFTVPLTILVKMPLVNGYTEVSHSSPYTACYGSATNLVQQSGSCSWWTTLHTVLGTELIQELGKLCGWSQWTSPTEMMYIHYTDTELAIIQLKEFDDILACRGAYSTVQQYNYTTGDLWGESHM